MRVCEEAGEELERANPLPVFLCQQETSFMLRVTLVKLTPRSSCLVAPGWAILSSFFLFG